MDAVKVRKNIFRIILIIWVILWVNFIARDLFRKGYIRDYRALIKRDAEGKRSYTYGDRFYEFLKFAKSTIQGKSDYEFVGVDDGSLASRRGIYYLYPCLKKEGPEYLLVYNVPGYRRDGFSLYAKLDNERFILKKR